MKTHISAIPTNIITGFLGVGKTSAILHLLTQKPAHERWAILVNEFGEIGIDGSLFTGQYSTEQGVFVREIPGGCMCCTANLPMQIALNQLLVRAKPDRLIIEPSGLGHPIEVLQTLSQEHYRNILDLQHTLTLVDARKLSDARYTQHEIFNQQIAIADIIVGNKLDLYQDEDKSALETYVKEHGTSKAQVTFTQQGEITLELLSGKSSLSPAIAAPHGHSHTHVHKHETKEDNSLPSEKAIPECGYITAVNKGEGFHSIGWRFSPSRVFEHKKLSAFLSTIQGERIKAVFVTDQGIFAYNLTADNIVEAELDECSESRIEIITDTIDEAWEPQLMACMLGCN